MVVTDCQDFTLGPRVSVLSFHASLDIIKLRMKLFLGKNFQNVLPWSVKCLALPGKDLVKRSLR